jgi:hypothetical protein
MAKRLGSKFWREHHESWARSGLTQVAYCAGRGLSLKTFQRWRGKELAAAKPVTLVPVSVNTAMRGGGIQLHSPGGWRIELSGANTAGLAELLRQLP